MPLRPIAPHYAPHTQPLKPFVPALPILTRYRPHPKQCQRLILALSILATLTLTLIYYAFSNL